MRAKGVHVEVGVGVAGHEQHWAARHRQAEVAAWGMAARIELLAWRTGNPVTRALRALRRAY